GGCAPCPVEVLPAAARHYASAVAPAQTNRELQNAGKHDRALGLVDQILRDVIRSEEHTSELQSLTNLVCRLLLEKKKNTVTLHPTLDNITRKCMTQLAIEASSTKVDQPRQGRIRETDRRTT